MNVDEDIVDNDERVVQIYDDGGADVSKSLVELLEKDYSSLYDKMLKENYVFNHKYKNLLFKEIRRGGKVIGFISCDCKFIEGMDYAIVKDYHVLNDNTFDILFKQCAYLDDEMGMPVIVLNPRKEFVEIVVENGYGAYFNDSVVHSDFKFMFNKVSIKDSLKYTLEDYTFKRFNKFIVSELYDLELCGVVSPGVRRDFLNYADSEPCISLPYNSEAEKYKCLAKRNKNKKFLRNKRYFKGIINDELKFYEKLNGMSFDELSNILNNR